MMRMDKLVRQCDMEVMKMAMLKHEETFRQQVHELHRLYRIQRQLMSDLTMAELSSGRRRQPRRSKQPRRALNLQLPADEYIVSADVDDAGDSDTAELLDLTLAVGGGGSSRKCHNAAAAAAAAASSPFASDCSGSSTGGLSSPSSAEYSEGATFLHAPPMPPPPCQRAMAFDLGMGEAMKQQQSPWLVQCQYLSLRMT
ncbi:uncharacterized protein LOC102718610 [Oryza brachyantha]|uniref:uncharacterized protein LOC102718610 n=1 Tax=Oryza brachyantha TaxID=4533 RepID=UPI001ADCCDF4|nr:uncharacterized protein LOC102718610 [Oryza brachyantha]